MLFEKKNYKMIKCLLIYISWHSMLLASCPSQYIIKIHDSKLQKNGCKINENKNLKINFEVFYLVFITITGEKSDST